ncbi:MAG: hypothetical protein ACRDPY_13095 [Streptosporangiaceae bacterium]
MSLPVGPMGRLRSFDLNPSMLTAHASLLPSADTAAQSMSYSGASIHRTCPDPAGSSSASPVKSRS